MIANPPRASEVSELDPYLKGFEAVERGKEGYPSWLFPLRKAGIARFAELGLPTTQDEDWRFTSLNPLIKMPFRPVLEKPRSAVTLPDLGKLPCGAQAAYRLTFIDGHFAPELSSLPGPAEKGRVMSLSQALIQGQLGPEAGLGSAASLNREPFAALNSAYFQDGVYIHLPAKAKLDRPVHLVFFSTGANAGRAVHPRNLIVAEAGSQLTLLETHHGAEGEPYFSNSVTEFIVGPDAGIEHCKLQDEASRAVHISSLDAHLSRGANFISHSLATGAKLSRNNIHLSLDGEGIECILNGLYLTRDEQVADHFMLVEHIKPLCNSHEYFNGIMDGRSKGVFHGRIFVHQEAQKTDAKQTNKNLLLSDEATADTKPQLEIYADDVKCTHGATIGQLDEDSIFYLRARGIGLQTARRMLIHAFAGEIIERIRCLPIREELDQLVWHRLEQNPLIAEEG